MKRKKYCLLAFFILVTIVLSGGIIHGSEVSVDAATTQTGLSGKMEAGITMTKMENLQKDGIRQNPGPDITSEKQVQQSPESLQ